MRGKRQGEGKRPPRIASVTLGAVLRMPPQVTGMARLASWLLGSWITFASYDKPFLGGFSNASTTNIRITYAITLQPPTANRQPCNVDVEAESPGSERLGQPD